MPHSNSKESPGFSRGEVQNPVKRLFDTRIKKLHGQGMAITGMAAVLGLAPSTVCRIMKRLGLKRNSWRGKSRKRA